MVLARRLLSAILFCGIWLVTGFVLGTSLLLGPVRRTLDAVRSQSDSSIQEKFIVMLAIGLLVVVSIALSAWIYRTLVLTKHKHLRFGLPLLMLFFLCGHLWLWMQPSVVQSMFNQGDAQDVDVTPIGSTKLQFSFGPYPNDERLEALKAEGVTTLVPLLHDAVIPMEPIKLRDEIARAEKFALEVISIPILPWIGNNDESYQQLRQLALEGEGHYYVHCYLGKDRVRMARRVIEEALASREDGQAIELVDKSSGRSIHNVEFFERGNLLHHPSGIIVTPFPTDDEMLLLMGSGNAGSVVSTLDPEDESDAPWFQKEKQQFEAVGIPFYSVPLPSRPFEPQAVVQLSKELFDKPKPVIVHDFLSADSGRSPLAEAIWMTLTTGRAALPSALFTEPMQGGPVELLSVHIATGPAPTGPEYGAYLYPAGVRKFIYLGPADTLAYKKMTEVCGGYGFDCNAHESFDDALLEKLDGEGPWYLFGPAVQEATKQSIRLRFGPPFPREADLNAWQAQATSTLLPSGSADHRTTGEIESSKPESSLVAQNQSDPSLLEDLDQSLASESKNSLFHRWKQFFTLAIPSALTFWLWTPALFAFAAFAAWCAGYLRAKRAVRVPYTRKTFHFMIFTLAAFLQWLAGLSVLVIFGTLTALLVLYATWRGEGFAFYESMARPTDAPRQKLFIWIPLGTTALGGVLSNVFFPATAIVGYLVDGWGDAIGEPVGSRWGKHRYRVPSLAGVPATRSLEGSLAVFIVGALAAVLGGLWLDQGWTGASLLIFGVVCGAVGALVEAVSNHGLDNLTIQLAAAGTAAFLL